MKKNMAGHCLLSLQLVREKKQKKKPLWFTIHVYLEVVDSIMHVYEYKIMPKNWKGNIWFQVES